MCIPRPIRVVRSIVLWCTVVHMLCISYSTKLQWYFPLTVCVCVHVCVRRIAAQSDSARKESLTSLRSSAVDSYKALQSLLSLEHNMRTNSLDNLGEVRGGTLGHLGTHEWHTPWDQIG